MLFALVFLASIELSGTRKTVGMKGDGGVAEAEGMDPRWMPQRWGKGSKLVIVVLSSWLPFNEKKVHWSFQIDDE